MTDPDEIGSSKGQAQIHVLRDYSSPKDQWSGASTNLPPSSIGSGAVIDMGKGGSVQMDAHTRDYIDKSIEASRAQNDARFAEVLSTLNTIRAENASQAASTTSRLAAMDAKISVATARFDAVDRELKDTLDAARAAETAAKNTKWNILFTGLSVVAILLAVWAIWVQAVEMTTGIVSMQPVVEQGAPSLEQKK